MFEGAAFAPGHASGIFQIFDTDPNPSRRGSRGCGACFSLGARTHVAVETAGTQQVLVTLDGEPADAPVTRTAVQNLIGKTSLKVQVTTVLDLPVSQGFGMSAAGALSTTLALAKAVGLTRTDAIHAAHDAEISLRTGLGDVVAATQGGLEMRKKPGLPPYGSVDVIPFDGEFVLAIVGGELQTRNVLSNPRMREAVNAAAAKHLERLFDSPTIENFFRRSKAFAKDSGLLTPILREAITAVEEAQGWATMSMLGNSIFAVGPTERVKEALEGLGTVYVTDVDTRGARVIKEIVRPQQ
jgi:pantoate kinase